MRNYANNTADCYQCLKKHEASLNLLALPVVHSHNEYHSPTPPLPSPKTPHSSFVCFGLLLRCKLSRETQRANSRYVLTWWSLHIDMFSRSHHSGHCIAQGLVVGAGCFLVAASRLLLAATWSAGCWLLPERVTFWLLPGGSKHWLYHAAKMQPMLQKVTAKIAQLKGQHCSCVCTAKGHCEGDCLQLLLVAHGKKKKCQVIIKNDISIVCSTFKNTGVLCFEFFFR